MRRDETVETSRPRHVNRSERRPRSTHDERESWEDSLLLSLFLLFFSSVRSVGGIREVEGCEEGWNSTEGERALISASRRYFRADRRDKKHLLRDAPISFVGRRRYLHVAPEREKRPFRLQNAC